MAIRKDTVICSMVSMFLVASKLNACRIFWSVAVAIATGAASALIADSWTRFIESPIVISLEKNYRDWNTSFPATTLCYRDKLDSEKARMVIQREWGVTDVMSNKYQYYLKFLSEVANISILNLKNLERFAKDENLNSKNLRNLAKDVNLDLQCKLVTFDSRMPSGFQQVLLEFGICYSYGSPLSALFSLTNPSKEINTSMKLLKCNYLNSQCYGRVENLQREVDFYIHSGYEVPNVASHSFTVRYRQERDTTFRALTIYASDELHRLNPKQRRCLFWNEESVYSVGLCEMQCRARLAEHLCGCVPHVYLTPKGAKMCNLRGLLCISQYADKVIEERIKCSCTPMCDSTMYQIDRDFTRFWKPPIPANIRYRWAIEIFSKSRLRRDVIFGFNDLLVSFGGTAALCLGFSLLTGVELIYYIFLYIPGQIYSLVKMKLRAARHNYIKNLLRKSER